MSLPSFLVIGAMKAGTTSLWYDLRSHKDVFMPSIKEPTTLAESSVITIRGRDLYEKLFEGAGAAKAIGEASTGYTKLPDIEGVPERAATLLGSGLKLVYLVRDPVARLVSHHRHLVRMSKAPNDVSVALKEVPALINYSCYAMQLRPWIEVFSADNLLVIRFEDYAKEPNEVRKKLASFLEIDPAGWKSSDVPELNTAKNHQPYKFPVFNELIYQIRCSQWYKITIGAWLPRSLKQVLKQQFGTIQIEWRPPNADQLAEIAEALENEERALGEILGKQDPIWELRQLYPRKKRPKSNLI